MGSFSDYAENKILDHVFKTTAYTPATHLYVALSTADPTDAGSGIAEPAGADAYARVICDAWDAASGGHIQNTGAVNFATPTGAWGTISHFAIFDALTGGNMIGHGAVAVPKVVGAGDTPSFAAGDIDCTLD